jgi:hypothetical protein
MNAIDILNNLKPYQELLKEVYAHELSYFQEQGSPVKMIKGVSIAYQSITLDLSIAYPSQSRTNGVPLKLYCRISFELADPGSLLNELYCEDESRIPLLNDLIHKNKLIGKEVWPTEGQSDLYYNEKVSRYLAMADAIAKRAENCAAGDRYQPGYFSNIFVNDERVVLSQVNHMNAKSLDHKKDYSLRKLKFTIPLTINQSDVPPFDYQIGEMLIEFSDRSSERNLFCGDAILEQVEKERNNFITALR